VVNSNVHNSTVSVMYTVHCGIDIVVGYSTLRHHGPCAGSISYGIVCRMETHKYVVF